MSYRDKLTERAAELLHERPGLTVERAWQLAIEDDPSLYVHHTPDGTEGSTGNSAPAPAPPRHFSTLSTEERNYELRKMRAGEERDPGKGYVVFNAAAGGGLYEVVK